ncbi:MAG: GTP cyclohydrolase, FolE2/MptA family, partial [Thermodesulfobacteriota bacterium]
MVKKALRDIQGEPDSRKIPIDKVGVKDIRYPVVVRDKKNKLQHTIATINLYVDLPHQFKGTHMSRFIEILNEHRREISIENFQHILAKIKKRFDATTAHLEVEFPYFIEKTAPVSKAKGLMEYMCKYSGTLKDRKDFVMEVSVPVTTLCPCSKEISERGA